MRIRVLLVVIVIILGLFPQPIAAQEDLGFGWILEVDKPIVFIGDSLNGKVTSRLNNTDYDLYLVNRTSGAKTFFYSGMTGWDKNDTFRGLILEELYNPGRYWLNVTLNNWTVAYTELTIIYNEDFLEKLWKTFVDYSLKWMTTAIKELDRVQKQHEERLDDLDSIAFFLYMGGVFVFEFVLVYVIIPVASVWINRMSRKSKRKQRLKATKGGIIQWHDKEPERIPDKSRPNTKPLIENIHKLKLAGYKEIDINQIAWITTGDPSSMLVGKSWYLNHPMVYVMIFISLLSFVAGIFYMTFGAAIVAIAFIFLFKPKHEELEEPETIECEKCNYLYDKTLDSCPICSDEEE